MENKRFNAGSITDAENNSGGDDYIVADKGNNLVNSGKTEKYTPNTVKLEFFEGPLDLLLSLIKKKKINIYDIPIKEITEDYLNAIGMDESRFKSDNSGNNGAALNYAGINIDIGGDFIVMAAHLIYIKSLMLLPKIILSDESSSENGINDADPRHELANMLIEYQKVKEIAYYLDNKPILGRDVFNINISNNASVNINNDNDNNSGICAKSGSFLFEANVYALSKAFYSIAKEAETRIDSYELKKTKFSIKEKIIEIVNILQDLKIIKFSELIFVCCNDEPKDNSGCLEKEKSKLISEIGCNDGHIGNNGCINSGSIYGRNKELFIIYFLSILEMSRLAIIRIDQEEYFGEIYISLSDEDELLNYKLKIENIS